MMRRMMEWSPVSEKKQTRANLELQIPKQNQNYACVFKCISRERKTDLSFSQSETMESQTDVKRLSMRAAAAACITDEQGGEWDIGIDAIRIFLQRPSKSTQNYKYAQLHIRKCTCAAAS
jgi:hypothetical protein